jgi:YidC/Oxa1 family membrane protein insertase
MERRVLLAVFLSFLVLYTYQAMLPQPKPAPAPVSQPPLAPASQGAADAPSTAASAGAGAEPAKPAAQTVAPAVDTILADTDERSYLIETNVVRARISNRGAVVTNWQLRHYRERWGRPVDLVPASLPPDLARPFALRLEDQQLTDRLRTALFKLNGATGTTVDGRKGPVTLVFEYQDASGLRVRKQFQLQPDSYVIRFSAEVAQGDTVLNPDVQWGPGLGDAVANDTSRYVQRAEGLVFADGKVQRLNASATAKQPAYDGSFGFAGIDDQYFLSATINPGRARFEYRPVSLPNQGAQPPSTRSYVAYDARFPQPPAGARFFFGPKDFDVLRSVDPELVRAINFGWFSWLVVPLLTSLKWVNGYVGNYGWSIIILTILINVAMFPLRHKSVVSMRKMQEIQPEVKAIQDRYSKLKTTDPARAKMNTELMTLYKERGVNPASGCIPMLLTMPVLFAFYSLLSAAIEIRGAPFTLWITDLAAHDPLYVTPLLMGASMVIQQKMTPTSADPAQQKIMMIMPVMFTFMFLYAPSGLVIYWLVSNVWAIGQQEVTNRMIGPPVVRTVRPPAERRLKRANNGKADGEGA